MRMFRLSPTALMVLAAVTALIPPPGLPAALAAQGRPDNGAGAPVCLVRQGTDGKSLAIIVPILAEKAMLDKGFIPEPCGVNFATSAARENYRDAVCHMASSYREQQIAVFERIYGERPGVLCGMAEVAVSQWRIRD